MTPNVLIVHSDLALAAQLKQLIHYTGEATVGLGIRWKTVSRRCTTSLISIFI